MVEDKEMFEGLTKPNGSFELVEVFAVGALEAEAFEVPEAFVLETSVVEEVVPGVFERLKASVLV